MDAVNAGVTVGFLGGPQDGRLQTVETGPDGNPPPVLEAMEPTGGGVDMRRTLIEGEPTNLPPLFRPVAYRLVVNRSDAGPRWLYVHPSITLPRVD